MSSQSLTTIKTISMTLISAALGLELWNLVATGQFPASLHSTLRFAHGALAIHAIEGLIAAFYASPRQKPPIRYGIYTFFNGFPGLVELFEQQEPTE